MADATIKADHRAKRKMLAHIFAQKIVSNLEPVLTDTIAVLVTQVHKHAAEGRPMNMRRYLNYFSIDVFSRFLYSESLRCLEQGNNDSNAETPDGKVYQMPFIKSLHTATVMNTALGREAPLLPVTNKLSWHRAKNQAPTMTESYTTTPPNASSTPPPNMTYSPNSSQTTKTNPSVSLPAKSSPNAPL